LAWSDIFNAPENYTRLCQQIINALLFLIAKKFVLARAVPAGSRDNKGVTS
jgi:hypothetical protein